MTIIQSYGFDNPVNFALSNVQIDAGLAKLDFIPNTAQTLNQPFTSGAGFTFNAANTEFVAGKMQKVDKTAPNSLFAATYTSVVDLNWHKSGGSTVGTVNGTPTIAAGKLVCTGGGVKGVGYSRTASGAGSIKVKYTPNYTGAPGANVNILGREEASGGNNRLMLSHSPAGDTLRMTLNNATGATVHSAATLGAAVVFVSGTTYEIELTWDNVLGNIRLFINGTLWGSLLATTWTQGATAIKWYAGAMPGVYNSANASFDDLILFDNVQHTATYVPGYTPPGTIYNADTVTLPTFTYPDIGSIQSLQPFGSVESGTLRYIVAGKYWNGAAWVVSNDTYAQANDFTAINTNIAALSVVGTSTLVVKVAFTNNNIQSFVDDLTVNYTGQKYSPEGYIEPSQALQARDLLGYADLVTLIAGTSYGIVLKIDGIIKYWDGIAWVVSNGTIAQSNDSATLITNFPMLVLGSGSSVLFRWLLASSVDNSTPELDYADVTYNFGGVPVPATTGLVYGFIRDISGVPVAGATVAFELTQKSSQYAEATKNIILQRPVSVTSDIAGQFIVPLIWNSQYDEVTVYKVTVKFGKVTISKSLLGADLTFSLPDVEKKDITELLPTP